MKEHLNYRGEFAESRDHVFDGGATAVTIQGFLGGARYDHMLKHGDINKNLTQQFVLLATAGSRFDLLLDNRFYEQVVLQWFGVKPSDDHYSVEQQRQKWHRRVLSFLFLTYKLTTTRKRNFIHTRVFHPGGPLLAPTPREVTSASRRSGTPTWAAPQTSGTRTSRCGNSRIAP